MCLETSITIICSYLETMIEILCHRFSVHRFTHIHISLMSEIGQSVPVFSNKSFFGNCGRIFCLVAPKESKMCNTLELSVFFVLRQGTIPSVCANSQSKMTMFQAWFHQLPTTSVLDR